MWFERSASIRLVPAGAALLLASACAPARPASPAGPLPAEPEPDVVWQAPAPVEPEVGAPVTDILGTVDYDLPVEANTWVEAELEFLVGQRSDVIRSWLERGDFYEPYIKQVLRDHGIPTDLYHLAAIESGFVPTARSHAGAVGMWQFMPATGRGMGLRIDSEVDERMDPVRSTRAAARHLRALYGSLGDWALSAAAYNAGSGRITRGMARFRANDFWELAQLGDLADETRRYVPRLYAVTVIGRDRSRFGLDAPAPTSHFAYDSVQVEYATPLSELARLGAGSEDVLRHLNPHLLRATTPAGGYWVWVPQGRGAETQRAWLASGFRRDRGLGSYTVRWGDNLGMIAQHSGLKAARIRELNPSIDFDRLQTGARLVLPHAAAQALAARPARAENVAVAEAAPAASRVAPEADEPVADPAARDSEVEPAGSSALSPASSPSRPAASATGDPRAEGRLHEVTAGETLWAIARAYGVSVADLEAENSLSTATIRPGQSLRIPPRAAAANATSSSRAAAEPDPAAKSPEAVVEHVVEPGESLWGIARRYGSTVEAIQEANGLGDRPIQPGQKLRVAAPRPAPAR